MRISNQCQIEKPEVAEIAYEASVKERGDWAETQSSPPIFSTFYIGKVKWSKLKFYCLYLTTNYGKPEFQSLHTKCVLSSAIASLPGQLLTPLRTVPAIVIAHTFCASRDTRVSYR